jgi:hypothetical protein
MGGCPAVVELTNGELLIIGKRLPDQLAAEVKHRIADDEFAICISADYFKNLPK